MLDHLHSYSVTLVTHHSVSVMMRVLVFHHFSSFQGCCFGHWSWFCRRGTRFLFFFSPWKCSYARICPQSSLGILRIPQLPPPLGHPRLKKPYKTAVQVHKTINPSQSVVKRVRHPRATYGPIGAVVDFSDAWTAWTFLAKMEGYADVQLKSRLYDIICISQ